MDPTGRQSGMSVDVCVLLKRKDAPTLPAAAIDRELVTLLESVRETESILLACEQTCCSVRTAQRVFKRFREHSGIELLQHCGAQGTVLTPEGHGCIALHEAARYCVDKVVRTHLLQDRPDNGERLRHASGQDPPKRGLEP